MQNALQFIHTALAHLSGGLIVISIFGFLFWKADNILSDAGRKLIYKYIVDTVARANKPKVRSEIKLFISKYYSREIPAFAFVANVLIFSVAALAIILVIYIVETRGLFTQLLTERDARGLFFGQVIGNGLLVVFIVNYFGFVYDQFRLATDDDRHPPNVGRVLLTEIVGKIVVFVVATGVIYVLFAIYAGAFVQSPQLAIKAVVPTLVYAVTFQNLTGVYFYSIAIGSLPLFLVAFIEFLGAHPKFAAAIHACLFWFNFENKPLRTLALALGTFFFFFSTLAYFVFGLIYLVI